MRQGGLRLTSPHETPPPSTIVPLIAPADSDRSPTFVEKNQVKSNGSFVPIPPCAIIAEGGDE